MDMKLYLQILANASGLKREMGESRSAVSRFTRGAKAELDALRGSLGTIQGKLAGVGISLGVLQQLSQSAHLDRGLVRLKQTAGETQDAIGGVRREFFVMSRQTGQQVEGLKEGMDALVQSGQSWRAALQSTKGINIASAVTGANQKTLASGLTVGSEAFNIDLEKPGKALEMLDKMTVAGRLGNAELENLSDIFARVGVNAASAGMGFEKTLAFIEGLSLVEKQPERLATLADSTLRLFTNLRYMATAQKGTGVKFFDDATGSRRDPLAVLADIKKRWDLLKTDKQRAVFMQTAFGHADLDTIKGLRTLLSGDALGKIGRFTGEIGKAGGTLQRELPEAINNAVDQTGRLKGALREAADGFAQPINKTLSDLIRFSMDQKKNGGLELSGKEMLGYGGGGVLGTMLLARYGSKSIAAIAGKMLSQGGSTAIGIAEGKVLQEAAGITPVFVTNWPGGMPGAGLPLGPSGPSGPSRALPLVAAAGLPAAVLAGPFASAYIGGTARANGWGAQSYTSSERQVMGIGGGSAPSLTSPFDADLLRRAVRPGRDQKNVINLSVRVDRDGRSFAVSDDINTGAEVRVQRGSFDAALFGGNY